MVNFVRRKKETREALEKMTWREKEKKTEELIEPFGLSYDKRRGILCGIQDSDSVVMVQDDVEEEVVSFFYENCQWKLRLQKGQYGVASGGKVTMESEDTKENLWIGFTLRKYGKVRFVQKGFQQELTGFLLGEWSHRKNLSMDIEISFPNMNMCDAFLEGLYHAGYGREECRILGNTVYFSFDRPKAMPPIKKKSQIVKRWWNRGICKIYRWKIRNYRRTMEGLLYLKEVSPWFFSYFLAHFVMKK